MLNLSSIATNRLSPRVSFLSLIALSVVVVLLSMVSLREMSYASAGDQGNESVATDDEEIMKAQKEEPEVDTFKFSAARQFKIGESREVDDMTVTLSEFQTEPFRVVFNLDEETVVFDEEGDIKTLGDKVFKLSQVAPYKRAARHLIRMVLLVGEQ